MTIRIWRSDWTHFEKNGQDGIWMFFCQNFDNFSSQLKQKIKNFN